MKKEEFKKGLLEQQIFDELKDSYFGGITYIKMKWQGLDIDYGKIYRRIINYRIKTYGTSFFTPNDDVIHAKEDYYRLNNNSRNRKTARLGKRREYGKY